MLNLYIIALRVAEYCRVRQWSAMVVAFLGLQLAQVVGVLITVGGDTAFLAYRSCGLHGYTLTKSYDEVCNSSERVFQFNPLNWQLAQGIEDTKNALFFDDFGLFDHGFLPWIPAAVVAFILVKALGEYAKRKELTA